EIEQPGTGKTQTRRVIDMPRWASRMTLIITDVRVERLQDITEVDAVAEGLNRFSSCWGIAGDSGTWNADPRLAFAGLWDSINGNRSGCSWKHNPWVAAYTFRPILGNIDLLQFDQEAAQ